MSFFINIYDKKHNLLDEINEIEVKTYSYTLNGINKFLFNIPLNCIKFTPDNFTELNHIELYENNKLKWWGLITNINFNNPAVEVGCLGYLYKLEKARLKSNTYYNIKYGDLVVALLNSTDNDTISVGNIIQDNIRTDRKIENTDMFLDKVTDLIEEMNYYIDIDENRKLNFYNEKGEDKSKFILQKTNDYSNIMTTPVISKSSDGLANCIYAETTFINEVATYTGTSTFSEKEEITLISEKRNEESIEKYGLLESVLKVNDIRLQETLDKYVEAELERVSYPLLSITIEAVDSALCPFEKVNVGDWIIIKLEDYFNLEQKVRIIELERNCITNTYKVTVGNVIYRENKISTKVFKG